MVTFVSLFGGGGAGIKSGREMVAWANEEGYAQKIKEYKWETWNSDTMEQNQQEFLQDHIVPFLNTKTKDELLEGAAKRRNPSGPRVFHGRSA